MIQEVHTFTEHKQKKALTQQVTYQLTEVQLLVQAETANGSGDAATFNDSEGVLMAEISALVNDGTFRNISLNSGSPLQSIRIFYRNDDNKIELLISSSNGNFYQASVSDTTSNNKLAVKYKENDTDMYINGFLVHTMTNVSMPVGLSKLDFYNNNTQPFYGNTKQIQYFDSALTDSELEQLTSWTSFSDMAERTIIHNRIIWHRNLNSVTELGRQRKALR